jgi:conjugative relaxase-like TrwC/TraI family protein
MSLVKLAPDGWRYFAAEIAAGREDYYARSAERPGLFVGRGAEMLGIGGQAVEAEMLERLIGKGRHPIDGSDLGRPFPDRPGVVAGFGLTFSPPKTVSVLWGTADIDTAAGVLAGHERAVESALAFLQDHRDVLAADRLHHDELSTTMTPTEVEAADLECDRRLAEQARARHEFLVTDQTRGAQHEPPQHHAGPVIGLGR